MVQLSLTKISDYRGAAHQAGLSACQVLRLFSFHDRFFPNYKSESSRFSQLPMSHTKLFNNRKRGHRTGMLAELLTKRRSIREFSHDEIPREAVRRLIWAGQGKSDDRGYKTVPSADALHPLRLFLTAGRVQGLERGLYSADPGTGDLQLIHRGDTRKVLEAASLGDQRWVADAACIVSICSDFVTPCMRFAEQPPFGRRGSRYVYIEAGAAAQNMHLQAVEDGLGAVLVAGIHDEETSAALGLGAPIAPVLHMCFGAVENDRK